MRALGFSMHLHACITAPIIMQYAALICRKLGSSIIGAGIGEKQLLRGGPK